MSLLKASIVCFVVGIEFLSRLLNFRFHPFSISDRLQGQPHFVRSSAKFRAVCVEGIEPKSCLS